MRSPDGATSNWGKRHLIAAYYSSIDPEGMKGWVGLVGWPVADGLPTLVVTRQLQVERRTEKVRRPKTDVLPLSHATNQGVFWLWQRWTDWTVRTVSCFLLPNSNLLASDVCWCCRRGSACRCDCLCFPLKIPSLTWSWMYGNRIERKEPQSSHHKNMHMVIS